MTLQGISKFLLHFPHCQGPRPKQGMDRAGFVYLLPCIWTRFCPASLSCRDSIRLCDSDLGLALSPRISPSEVLWSGVSSSQLCRGQGSIHGPAAANSSCSGIAPSAGAAHSGRTGVISNRHHRQCCHSGATDAVSECTCPGLHGGRDTGRAQDFSPTGAGPVAESRRVLGPCRWPGARQEPQVQDTETGSWPRTLGGDVSAGRLWRPMPAPSASLSVPLNLTAGRGWGVVTELSSLQQCVRAAPSRDCAE